MDSKDLIGHDVFFQNTFSVDECLSKYTHKTDLETLRRELKNFGSELQTRMSEILRAETEAIVNLAEYLTNLNTKIDILWGPICQLREELMTLNSLIQTAEGTYSTTLQDLKENNTSQNNVHLKLGIILSSSYINKFMEGPNDLSNDLLILERIVLKFSFQKKYVDVLGIMTSDLEEIVNVIETKLVKVVDKRFLDAYTTNDANVLLYCLRMYDNLGKQQIAQEIFRIKIVKPYLENVFSEKHFEKVNQNLDQIYADVHFFINEKMKTLTTVIEQNSELISFNFIKNSVWKELDKQSRVGLPYITAPGNPELFQKRFNSTWELLQQIAIKCGNVDLLREDETFQEHMKRFNLPVYFEICYQKIAGTFETDLIMDNHSIYASTNEISCKLKPTLSLWSSVSRCFSKDVFINQLADQFLKLAIMLLSRYLGWFTLKELNAEQFIMDSLADLSIVENFMALNTDRISDINNTLFSIFNDAMRPHILKAFKVNRKCIAGVKEKLKEYLINVKFQESVGYLQNVGAIPRLYRRTNRNAPKEPSAYVVEALKPILEFNSKFVLSGADQSEDILEKLLVKITKQYYNLVQDVLQSVCKTEESLRRLKSRNLSSIEETAPQSDTISDEMKIREQIKYDGLYFLDKLYNLTTSREAMELLKKEIF